MISNKLISNKSIHLEKPVFNYESSNRPISMQFISRNGKISRYQSSVTDEMTYV